MSLCYCSQCGKGSSDFEMAVTEVGYIMTLLCHRCRAKTESLVHAEMLQPEGVA